MIKAVFIDIDNTLLDFNQCAKQAMEIAFNNHNIKFDEKVFPTFKKVNDGLWLQIEKKEITREILHDIRWNKIFAILNIDFDGHIIEKEFLENLNETAVPVEGALDLVKYLSKKYTVCTASNAFYNQQVNRLTKSKIIDYVDKIFVSEKLGVSKPDRTFFEKAFNELGGITPSQSVIIGDSITADINGGKQMGMQTVWYNPYNEKSDVLPDYTVSTLREIKNIL